MTREMEELILLSNSSDFGHMNDEMCHAILEYMRKKYSHYLEDHEETDTEHTT